MNHQITFTTSGPVMNRYDVSWKVDGGIFNIVHPQEKKTSVVWKTAIFYNCKKR